MRHFSFGFLRARAYESEKEGNFWFELLPVIKGLCDQEEEERIKKKLQDI